MDVRNWKVVGLSPRNTVLLEIEGRVRVDSGEKPSEIGTWGLSRQEVRILRRGLTASGRDREVPK